MNVPDLRYLAADNGGVFPGNTIVAIIDGRSANQAHTARQMPVWGDVFANANGSDAATATAKIHALVSYLESIQQHR